MTIIRRLTARTSSGARISRRSRGSVMPSILAVNNDVPAGAMANGCVPRAQAGKRPTRAGRRHAASTSPGECSSAGRGRIVNVALSRRGLTDVIGGRVDDDVANVGLDTSCGEQPVAGRRRHVAEARSSCRSGPLIAESGLPGFEAIPGRDYGAGPGTTRPRSSKGLQRRRDRCRRRREGEARASLVSNRDAIRPRCSARYQIRHRQMGEGIKTPTSR